MAPQNSISTARKKLEERFKLTCDTVTENVKRTLDDERKNMMREFDERLILQAQLPGMDLSSYDVVQKFDFDWIYKEARALTVKVGDQSITNVTVQPSMSYEGFFLFKKKEARKA